MLAEAVNSSPKSVSTPVFSQQKALIKEQCLPLPSGVTDGARHERPESGIWSSKACLPAQSTLGKLKSTTPAWESSLLGSLSLKATWKMWYRDKEAGKLAAHAWDAATA